MIGALLAALLATADVGTAEKGDLYDDSRVVTNVNESAFVKWGETQGKTLRITGGFGPWSSSTGGIDIAGSTLKAYGTELYPGIVRLHSPASPRMGSYLDVGSGAGVYFEGTGDMPLPAAYGLYGWESLDQRIRRLAPVHSESDPVFRRWSETNSYVKSESDPVFTRWTETNRYVKAEGDPVFSGWIGDELGGTNVFRAKTDLVVYDGTPQSPTADRLATVSGVKGLIAGATNSLPSGAARPLPPYLHFLSFSDTYPDDAAWYYAQPQDYGGCSVVRNGGTVSRNFDFPFDSRAEFVVSVSAAPGRYASIGVANCGTNLSEEIVTSGKWSRYYRCLPGKVVDGVNEKGVVCEVNVVDGDPRAVADDELEAWKTDGDIHPLAAVRWVLDNADSAEYAATSLARRVAFPAGWTQNFHWMIFDRDSSWVVEDGVAVPCDYGAAYDGPPAMTNFRVVKSMGFPRRYFYQPLYVGSGEGAERFEIITNSAKSITDAWYTKAYSPLTSWLSEFGNDGDVMAAVKELWAASDRESHRGQRPGGKAWWQTLHTSVYDVTNMTLRIAVQEDPTWYAFSLPASGGSNVEVDPTLSVEGMAADAKAVGDAIAEKPSYSAVTGTVNEVKRKFWDEPLEVEWTFVASDGEFMMVATTNVNTEVLH